MVKFISEVSSNHNQDMSRMKDFIEVSAEIGCAGVKFQLFKIEELFSKEILKRSKKHRLRKHWELKENLIPELYELCLKNRISFSCTPFYLDAVKILDPFVDFYKIASYELLWKDLFLKCSENGKPIVFSTGMAIKSEIEDALRLLIDSNCDDITILHCNSAYPTPVKDANLSSINTLKKMIEGISNPMKKKIKIGYSDHTVSPAVIYRAVHKYDSQFIEFHIDLDGNGEEFKAGHCWLPEQMSRVISDVNNGFHADGNSELKPSKSEMNDRNWRADPFDGLRPLKPVRSIFSEE